MLHTLGRVEHFMRIFPMTSKAFALLLVLASLSLTQGAYGESCASLREAQGQDIVSVHCGGAPSATFDANGRLWVVFVQSKHVYVSYSDDKGVSYSNPVLVNQEAEDTEFNGENRPKIVVAPQGEILLSWTTKTSSNFTGLIRFSRSTDGGRSFTVPRTINDDGLTTGHRFDSLFLTESGNLYLTWIDKRDMEASLAQGKEYPGAAIYYAVSKDFGKTFSQNYGVSQNSCECCRIAVAPQGNDKVAILWRQIYDSQIRDHAIAVLGPNGEVSGVERATVDDWYIDACPHHGPSMVQAQETDDYHMAWFSAGDLHKGIYYARYDLEQADSTQLIEVDATPGAGHPSLAQLDGELLLVWKGFNGVATQLQVMRSMDGGKSWSDTKTILSTEQASDHPLLISNDSGLYLSWASAEFGYVFKELSHEH